MDELRASYCPINTPIVCAPAQWPVWFRTGETSYGEVRPAYSALQSHGIDLTPQSTHSLPPQSVLREPSVRFNPGYETATKLRENLQEIRSYLSGSLCDLRQRADASQTTPASTLMTDRPATSQPAASTARPVLPPPPKLPPPRKRTYKRKAALLENDRNHIQTEQGKAPTADSVTAHQDVETIARQQSRSSQTPDRKVSNRGGRRKRQSSSRIVPSTSATMRASTSSERPLKRFWEKMRVP